MEHLLEGFEFDRWANRLWFAAIEEKGWPEPDRAIFQHILAAQEAWLKRLSFISLREMPTPEVSLATIDRLTDAWCDALKVRDPQEIIAYRRYNGEELTLSIEHIARHVVDHGTYHRGELRGLCRSRGDDAFPETGFALYCTLFVMSTP